MIKKKSMTAAFTLIELLVVITIIGILAGIALPVFNSVQVKSAQTKCLAQAKQVGLALKLFASDNDGNYPQKDIPTGIGTPTTSNNAFAALFPTYVQNESIFWNKLAKGYCKNTAPDNRLDAAGTYPNTQTLASGENAYGYMMGLTDTDNPSYPLVFDATTATNAATYSSNSTVAGGTWGGTKAIVIHLDNSGSIDTLTSAAGGGSPVDNGPTGGANNTNILDKSAQANWLGNDKSLLDPTAYAAGGG